MAGQICSLTVESYDKSFGFFKNLILLGNAGEFIMDLLHVKHVFYH